MNRVSLAIGIGALAAALPSAASAAVFTYTSAPVVFADDAETATPITVAGLTGTVTAISVTLNGFYHTFPSDMVLGLQNITTGQGLVFLSEAGGSADVSGLTLTFSAASTTLASETLLTSGSYGVSNYGGYSFTAGDLGTSFTAFNGFNPNAVWNLLSLDAAAIDTGGLTGGWTLSITTSAGAVPEPGTWAMLIGGFGVMGGAMRRRAKTTTAVTFA
ncbi:MAG: PEP-CTERM sorting domain-containing protein [Sphingomonadales bacterium]|nr:MAG: PEP-CTERM sorting domain-containing protein [Sphingomonadales bacterium]